MNKISFLNLQHHILYADETSLLGTCTDRVNAFSCACQPGFTGLHCDVNIDDCPSFGCGNGKHLSSHVYFIMRV